MSCPCPRHDTATFGGLIGGFWKVRGRLPLRDILMAVVEAHYGCVGGERGRFSQCDILIAVVEAHFVGEGRKQGLCEMIT